MLWDLPSITQLYMLCCESRVLEVSLLWLKYYTVKILIWELFGVSALAHCAEHIVQLDGDSESLGILQ